MLHLPIDISHFFSITLWCGSPVPSWLGFLAIVQYILLKSTLRFWIQGLYHHIHAFFLILFTHFIPLIFQADPSKPVLVAGDPERAHVTKVEKEDGINYHINQIKDSVSTVIEFNFPCTFSSLTHPFV